MLYAGVHLPNFPAQAALRNDAEARQKPFAVVAGTPPQVRVVALNSHAKKMGLWVGMTKADAETQSSVKIRERLVRLESLAHAALQDCLAGFSPWCEDVAPDLFVLDISGLSNLMGTPVQIAKSIREQARTFSLYIKIGVAHNIDSAIHAARLTKNVLVLPTGGEAEILRDAPLEILEATPEILGILHRWGIRRFGQLAALPELALSERLGQEGLRLQRLTRGISTRILSPTVPSMAFEEEMEFDHSVEDLKSLAFVFHRLLGQLVLRLATRALAAGEIHLTLHLDLAADGVTAKEPFFTRTLKLPVPSVDVTLLLKLLQLDLEAHPPGAPVMKVVLHIEPMRPRVVQNGMFVPQGPEPQRLELTLAKLRRIVGEDRVGSPELMDRHLPVPFRMANFTPSNSPSRKLPAEVSQTAVRIFRPALPTSVEKVRGTPRRVRFSGKSYQVSHASGPWRRSGEWWTRGHWGRDEWDLVLVSGDNKRIVVRAYRDLVTGHWSVEAEYD
ncbi:DNA polymerase Y family protein [Granulicella sp. L60]|uniref:DNA polymerase Y family protein n=1 Tax=Granulicella sp. L60 TaxID=1641866 RepID=UPI00131BDF8E|nr:DNA polymerase Y family protein [Granulicella sp. L60]